MNSRADGSSAAVLEQPESPFLGLSEPASLSAEPLRSLVVETPFLSEYRLADEVISNDVSATRQLLAELFDSEFDESLEELLAEAEAEAERLETDETPGGDARADRTLERWIEPLRLEAEAMLERMATALDGEDLTSIGETELDEVLDRFEPRDTGLSPTFEGFLGKVWRKAKKAVSGAARLVKKGIAAVGKLIPIGAILRQLASLVRPLLRRVVRFALGKLPPALRPYAAQLAKRFVGELEMLDEFDHESVAPAAPDVRHLQLGFDAEVATLLLAPTEVEREDLVGEAGAVSESDESSFAAELDQARSQFIGRFEALQDGEDPTPLVEEFLPAILPVVRLGIRLAGRPKIVRFLAGYLGRLIAPYVAPQVRPALSKAIVDAGLRLMTLETDSEDQLSGEAFANAIEDTVRHVAGLSEEEWEDELALEEAAYEGFHEAAAGAFPGSLLNPASEQLETSRPSGTWVAMPRQRRARYRKYSRVFPVAITPQVARTIRTFGGRSLASVIATRLGPTGTIEGRLHLYQAVPGTRIGRILRAEGRAAAFQRPGPVAVSAVHPLTREAAGALLGEPGLGREVSEAFLDRPEPVAIGQRLFYLELPTAQPAPGRPSGATVTFRTRSNDILVRVFLCEADAQSVAARLRRKEPLGASLVTIARVYRPAIERTVTAPRPRMIVGEEPEQGELTGQVLRIGRMASHVITAALRRWVRGAIAAALVGQPDAFVAAASNPADGVVLTVRLKNPPGFRSILAALRPGVRSGERPRSIAHLREALRGRPEGTAVEITHGAVRG
jgi:hypothetical protein